MNVLFIQEDGAETLPFNAKTFPLGRNAETAHHICEDGDMPDIIQTSGAKGAMFAGFLRTSEFYAPFFRKTRIVHTVGRGETDVTFSLSENYPDAPEDMIKNISAGGRIYPTAGAVIYCDRVIIRGGCTGCNDPLLPHYMRQFGFKIYDLPDVCEADYERIYASLIKPRSPLPHTGGA